MAGGFVLTLPVSSADGRTVGIRQAMFTATSAVCVTGLSIVDVGVELSFFGQAVLLMLIQVGGLGFMAFATLIMVALGRRISLRDRMILRDAMNQEALSGMVRLTLAFLPDRAGGGAVRRAVAHDPPHPALRPRAGRVAEPVHIGERVLQRGV